MNGKLLCISLWQPWATALFIDLAPGVPLKPDETRHWPLPGFAIGRTVGIHAAKRDTRDEREFWEDMDSRHHSAFAAAGFVAYAMLPRGALIGTLTFSNCIRTENTGVAMGSDAGEWGNYAAGRFAWGARDRTLFARPIPTIGRQGFFHAEVAQ